MYADKITGLWIELLKKQKEEEKYKWIYNEEHGIVPKTIIKEVRDVIEATKVAEESADYKVDRTSNYLQKIKNKLIKAIYR